MNEKKVGIPSDRLVDFCQRHHIRKLALFGSVLRDDFGPDSDVDVLAEFAPDARWTLFDLVHMQDELKDIFGRGVDLVSWRGIESSRNYIRRKQILDSAEVIHPTTRCPAGREIVTERVGAGRAADRNAVVDGE